MSGRTFEHRQAPSGFTKERLFSAVALTLLLGVVLMVTLSLVLKSRGEAAMELSDEAFHRGDLAASIDQAKLAGLAYVPGSQHVRAAEGRLVAIASGAEAEGQPDLARRAWDALRMIDEQTRYPGRGVAESGERARAALRRLDAARKLGQETRPGLD